MEKNTIRGAGGVSSRHEGDRIGEVNHSDSDEDDDNSMLVEKEEEDSHSSIDTIEEEVDLSSEGSDHEEQQQDEEAQPAATGSGEGIEAQAIATAAQTNGTTGVSDGVIEILDEQASELPSRISTPAAQQEDIDDSNDPATPAKATD